MFEWNTWRAMTMLDGGNIKANLKFDDFGNPMSTAQGNMADIVCNYDAIRQNLFWLWRICCVYTLVVYRADCVELSK